MKPIKKQRPEPKELTKFRQIVNLPENEFQKENIWNTFKGDESALLPTQWSVAKEQGFVCCYCQKELETYIDSYKRKRVEVELEHYKPKSIYDGSVNSEEKAKLLCDKAQKEREDLRINYQNLLGACGSSGHCGNKKSDTELCFIPNPGKSTEKDFPVFCYNMKGKMRPSDDYDDEKKEALTQELNDVLNLNDENLKKLRVSYWVALKNKIKRECKIEMLHSGKQKEERYVKELMEELSQKNKEGKFHIFYDCLLHLLKSEYKNRL